MRALLVGLAVAVLAAPGPAAAQPAPPGPPGPPGPPPPPRNAGLAVPRHLAAAAENLGRARSSDRTGRRALLEARTSLAAAQAALATRSLRSADELAASADDLTAAANGPPERGHGLDPAQILARVDGFAAVLAGLPEARVQTLLTFARSVADEARRKAARGEADAGWEAARAEAIARAATHVAIAAVPSLAPQPPPPNPPPGRPS